RDGHRRVRRLPDVDLLSRRQCDPVRSPHLAVFGRPARVRSLRRYRRRRPRLDRLLRHLRLPRHPRPRPRLAGEPHRRSQWCLTELSQWLTLIVVKVAWTVAWDEAKNLANQRKHGVSFEEAQELFLSKVDYLEFYDDAHSDFEDRFSPSVRSHVASC